MKHAAGLELWWKPTGVSSFSLVQTAMQEIAAARARLKVCHGGTLDPFADGLLVLLAGPATHLFEPLHELPKTYEATIAWGAETDSGDGGGRVIATGAVEALMPERIAAASLAMLGWTEQVPPSLSAKKVDGEPAYRRVWKGEEVTLAPSRVFLHSAEWVSHDLPRSSVVRLVCRGGYYVRAFARDLARRLDSRAHVVALRRTAIGPWRLEAGAAPRALVGVDCVPWMERLALTDAEVGTLRQRQQLPTTRFERAGWQVPAGFPPPQRRVALVHQSRVVGFGLVDDTHLTLERPLSRGF